jgi:ubiquinone/menaquinone biosynthesis C-methylase UbiE
MTHRVIDDGMRAYYERRAAEYDNWWLGAGLFRGRDRPGWTEEVEELVKLTASLPPARVLDVACGTGFLTRHLRGEVTALDQSQNMLDIAASRMPDASVVRGDAVPLPFRAGDFERVFTSHFYGHLLDHERGPFLHEARRVGTQLVVVDSALRPDVATEQWQERVLEDGSRHNVYKRFFTASQLAAELGGGETLHEGRWFVAVSS